MKADNLEEIWGKPGIPDKQTELKVQGTPRDFAVMAQSFRPKVFFAYGQSLPQLPPVIEADDNPVKIWFVSSDRPQFPTVPWHWQSAMARDDWAPLPPEPWPWGSILRPGWYGLIEAQAEPGGTRLFVWALSDYWQELEKYWKSLVDELIRRGWSLAEESATGTKNQETTNDQLRTTIPVAGIYGTDRDMSIEQVQEVVGSCIEYQARGGSITEFYRRWNFNTGQFQLETLRKWMKDPRFHSEDAN